MCNAMGLSRQHSCSLPPGGLAPDKCKDTVSDKGYINTWVETAKALGSQCWGGRWSERGFASSVQ